MFSSQEEYSVEIHFKGSSYEIIRVLDFKGSLDRYGFLSSVKHAKSCRNHFWKLYFRVLHKIYTGSPGGTTKEPCKILLFVTLCTKIIGYLKFLRL